MHLRNRPLYSIYAANTYCLMLDAENTRLLGSSGYGNASLQNLIYLIALSESFECPKHTSQAQAGVSSMLISRIPPRPSGLIQQHKQKSRGIVGKSVCPSVAVKKLQSRGLQWARWTDQKSSWECAFYWEHNIWNNDTGSYIFRTSPLTLTGTWQL